jgi:hypothetical protein
MIMKRCIRVAICGLVFCPLLVADAQRPISIGLGGGVSIPEGDLRDGVTTGWHALGTVAVGSLMQPLGLRLDAAYNRFAFSDEAQALFADDANQTIGSVTLNASYRLPMTNSSLSPYIISGLGAYRTECSVDPGCDASTRYGWNAGLGTKLYILGVRSFLEGRYHRTDRGERDVHYFPVTFGLMF